MRECVRLLIALRLMETASQEIKGVLIIIMVKIRSASQVTRDAQIALNQKDTKHASQVKSVAQLTTMIQKQAEIASQVTKGALIPTTTTQSQLKEGAEVLESKLRAIWLRS